MKGIKYPWAALLLLVSLILFLPGTLRAGEKTAEKSRESSEKMTSPDPEEKKPQIEQAPMTGEDRQVVENLDLLELMALLQDMDVIASMEDRK